jgi:hypothetical protein
MKLEDWNRTAVHGLLADAERALALTDLGDVRGNREIVQNTVANARQNYIDLIRRSRPIPMTDGESSMLRSALDGMKARLRFFGERV